MNQLEYKLPFELPDESLSQDSGVLPAQWIKKLADRGQIGGRSLDPGQIQPASLDLRLGRRGYKIHASFLPGRDLSVSQKIERLASYEIDLSRPQVLTRSAVYLFEIEENLRLGSTISAVANPKSSTGRLDVFTRVIADRTDAFDVIPPGYAGKHGTMRHTACSGQVPATDFQPASPPNLPNSR